MLEFNTGSVRVAVDPRRIESVQDGVPYENFPKTVFITMDSGDSIQVMGEFDEIVDRIAQSMLPPGVTLLKEQSPE